MDVSATATLEHPFKAVGAVVFDLGTYPDWLGIVRSAEVAPAVDVDPGPAWMVEVGARLGPFWRTKRVRMVQVTLGSGAARFERMEHDGRDHSAWVLTGAVKPTAIARTEVRIDLHYGGARWLPLVDAVLRDEIRRAGPRLDRYLRAR